jgi:hypothetical protein
MDTNRWTSRLRTPDRSAQQAAELTTEAMSRMLDESLRLDAEQWPALRAVSAG